MWHQPCQRCKYTTSVDIQNAILTAIRSCRITCERSESARERRTALYKSDQKHNNTHIKNLKNGGSTESRYGKFGQTGSNTLKKKKKKKSEEEKGG